jgi:hypothetical protein
MGKKQPFGSQDDEHQALGGLEPSQGSGDTRKTGGGARQPGETRGSGDTRGQ